MEKVEQLLARWKVRVSVSTQLDLRKFHSHLLFSMSCRPAAFLDHGDSSQSLAAIA
jgi:hypothetical protein